MKSLIFGTATLAVLMGGAAPAHASNLTCNVSNAGASRGWISDNIQIENLDGTEMILVSDRQTAKHLGTSAIGRVDEDSDTRATYVWEVAGQDSQLQYVKMQYRLTFTKATQKMRMTVTPLAQGGNITGKGVCRVTAVE